VILSQKHLKKRIKSSVIHFHPEFAQIIKSIVNGADSSIRYLPAVEDDPQRRRPDITRAKKYLNWEPKVLLTFSVNTVLFKIGV
jgi:UDP-glucuronate decarboxylase